MDTKKWFVLLDDKISGPFESSEVESKIGSISDAEIWGRGLPEWVDLSRWKSIQTQHPAMPNLEAERRYKFRYEGKESQFLSLPQIVSQLKRYRDFTHMEVCGEGLNEWTDIFKVPQIVDQLGISRRTHTRVPIMGTADCETGEYKFRARVISISQGGIGITEGHGLQIGQKYKIAISSPNLFVVIHCTCEVVYVGQDGYAGLRFENISGESKSVIVEYVRKFQEAKEV